MVPADVLVSEHRSERLREAEARRLLTAARNGGGTPRQMPAAVATSERRLPMRSAQEPKTSWLRRTLGGRRLLYRDGYLRRLEQVPLFRGLSRRDLGVVARTADQLRFREGATLAREHAPRPQFVVILSGAAEATFGSRPLSTLGSGDHFGELTLLEGAPQVPTVTALTDVEGLVMGRRQFWGLLNAIPALAVRLTASLGEELRFAHQRLAGDDIPPHPARSP